MVIIIVLLLFGKIYQWEIVEVSDSHLAVKILARGNSFTLGTPNCNMVQVKLWQQRGSITL